MGTLRGLLRNEHPNPLPSGWADCLQLADGFAIGRTETQAQEVADVGEDEELGGGDAGGGGRARKYARDGVDGTGHLGLAGAGGAVELNGLVVESGGDGAV